MKSNVFNLLAVVCIVLALAGALAIRLTQAQALDPLNGSVIQGTTLGAAFTYQGRLTDAGGDPVPGPCDFQFSLWDDGLAGSQVGSTQTKSNVTLENGYFSAALDFGAAAFQGEARYLQVAVSCPAGSGSYTPLSGRVELTAAPYALGLRPGAIISGNSTGNILSAQNSSSIGGGIYGQVAGLSGLTPLTGAGVWGDSASVAGMVGTSNSAVGVFGWSVSNAGVSGLSSSGYGVYGASITNKAIYSDGDAHVEGDLTWKAKTSYISIPATAFTPQNNPSGYYNYGYMVSNSAGGTFYAPVQLPHGAIVTGMTFYWFDNDISKAITCTLRLDAMGQAGSFDSAMAEVVSTGSSGSGFGSTGSISEATIDNQHYIYYLKWEWPVSGGLAGRGVVIAYTITEPY
ncbi:MAG TPA: hypothetical protein PKZ84_03165 [Anaerolineae bacterium]|nr:hypothetical protein [Anaerolineae bacterium]HQI84891.1 hypothetical protein [Anaerolineae bacterium]